MSCTFRLGSCLLALSLSVNGSALALPQSVPSPFLAQDSVEGEGFADYLSGFGFRQRDSSAQGSSTAPTEEANLRALVEKYFAAFSKKDLATIVALWSEKSPNLASYKQILQQRFTTEDLSFGSPTISRVKVENERASLRVAIALTSINLKSQQKGERLLALIFEFAKQDGDWKVWRCATATEDLAEVLAKANGEAERASLLEEQKELVTVELGSALLTQGRWLLRQGSSRRALEIYELAMEIAGQLSDQGLTAGALRGIGSAQGSQGNYVQALEQYHKSLKICDEIGDKVGIADTLNSIGGIHYRQGNYLQALEQYQKSQEIFREIGNKAGIADTLNNFGNIYHAQGKYIQALEQYQKSLEIKEGIGNKPGIAATLNNIGNVYDLQGNYAQALKQYQKSLEIYKELGTKAGIAATLNNIGNVNRSQGNYAQALVQSQKSLKIYEEIGDKAGLAIILHNLGNIYQAQGNSALALEQFQKSLEIKMEMGNKAGIARTLNNIGAVYASQNNHIQALEQYQKSLKICEEIGDKAVIPETLDNIGTMIRSQGNYALALEQYQKSLKIAEATGDKASMARALSSIGETHRLQGNYTQALQFAERAVDTAAQIGGRELCWEARVSEGKTYFALNQLSLARRSFDDAIASIESLRTQVAGGEQEKQRFFESRVSPYYAIVELLIAQDLPGEALSYAERAKARVLLDILSSGRASITKTMTDLEIEQERKLNSQLVSLNAQVYRQQQRQQADPNRLNQLDSELEKARLDFEAFQTNLYAAHPELKPQRGEVLIIKADEIAALLPDARSALLEYVVTDDQTYLFAITKAAGKTEAEVRVYPLLIKRAELAKQTERFRGQLAERHLDFRASARQLYQLLLKPAEAQLQGKTNLIIVPDDRLWELPFQALINRDHRFLIENAAISYAPSLTVLHEMIKQRPRHNVASTSLTLLALGNPVLGQETIERAKLALRDGKLEPLPEAEQEVRALGQLYGSSHSQVYIGAEAREARAKAEAGGARILHFATHGMLNNASPMYSHLVLAQGDANEDGLLEAWELMQLDLKADLAVLSACETARGRFGAGEGTIGLTWALFVAGVPSTVVSQWKVESASTRDLMLNFHRQLKSPPADAKAQVTKAEALRRAALVLMKMSETRHPFYWAGFGLVGDGR